MSTDQKVKRFNKEGDISTGKHWWFSGRILACHAGGRGSIPGQCKRPDFFSFFNSEVTFFVFLQLTWSKFNKALKSAIYKIM